ncbi:hypothetical protein E4656_03075 [Natronospirillum operosum]|uniref:Uncharacterized protein n=1 Tax=Natronospirillum operosum TaxID=2759953 RepID=A0A4Z0WIF6_9GAMM|nr:hypothetical protein [Natronospirillum operosum]TGG95421.1 hypothetical protein E4656_03075 [Natronospirillum operosum]
MHIRNVFISIGLMLMMIYLFGCASTLLDREDRLRKHEVTDGKVGINITTATRRLAIVQPSGRTCSELSPPAVIQANTSGEIGINSGTQDEIVSASGERDETAVKLLETTERIECLRIALFHACGIGVQNEMSADEESKLLQNTIQMCGLWGSSFTIEE